MKGLVFHLAALCLAALLAASVWLRGEEAAEPSGGDDHVVVWDGRPASIERIRFEAPNRKVVLDAKKDGGGRYFVVTVDKDEAPRSPHGMPDASAPEKTKHTTARFIGVKAAGEMADKLAPLTAVRDLGKYDPKQAEEFGFDKPEGTLGVKLGSTEHSLAIGGTTPGGQERYAREVQSGRLFALSSDVVQSMLGAETRLIERDLHAFEDGDVTRIELAAHGKKREIVAIPDKKGAWADAASPAKLDETVGNWMAKVGRLRVMEYVEKPPPPPESEVVRIEYFGGKKVLGYLELFEVPGEKGSDYLIRTEYGRWYVKVLSSVAEQVDQDLASVLK